MRRNIKVNKSNFNSVCSLGLWLNKLFEFELNLISLTITSNHVMSKNLFVLYRCRVLDVSRYFSCKCCIYLPSSTVWGSGTVVLIPRALAYSGPYQTSSSVPAWMGLYAL